MFCGSYQPYHRASTGISSSETGKTESSGTHSQKNKHGHERCPNDANILNAKFNGAGLRKEQQVEGTENIDDMASRKHSI